MVALILLGCVNGAFLIAFCLWPCEKGNETKGKFDKNGHGQGRLRVPWKTDADRASSQRYTSETNNPFVCPQIMLICGQCCYVVRAKDAPDNHMKEKVRCSKYSVKN